VRKGKGRLRRQEAGEVAATVVVLTVEIDTGALAPGELET
jgi:hypothetical protein